MKKRLWWSMLFSSAALLVTSVTMFAQRPVAIYNDPVGRAPSQLQNVPARVPATYTGQPSTNPADYVAWEGFNSTNYLNRVSNQFAPNFADIAVGPTDVLTIVNRRIARWRNPKAAGATPINTTNPVNHEAPSNEALLDAWLGQQLLARVCPTTPRSSISCLIDQAAIRYDQMQGRFVVLMAVVDTGIQTFGATPSSPRRATWVLAISKYATFFTGAGNPNPSNGGTGASDLFIAPTPPFPSGSGTSTSAGVIGWNTANWVFYWGENEDAGNINSATDVIGTTTNRLVTTAPFDCSVAAATTQSTTSVCYFPTSARIGLDNDNVIVTSSVINSNLVSQTPSSVYTIGTGTTLAFVPAFAGTRVRVFKKTALYTNRIYKDPSLTTATPVGLTAGVAQTAAGDYTADYYDLYALQGTGTVATALLTPPALPTAAAAVNSAFPQGASFAPYTLAPPQVETIPTGNGGTGVPSVIASFCEPQELRGRPAASFSNLNVPSLATTPVSFSTSYIVCTQSTANRAPTSLGVGTPTGVPTDRIYVQAIQYFTAPPSGFTACATCTFGIAYVPQLLGGPAATTPFAGVLAQSAAWGGINSMQVANVAPFANPTPVPQAPARDGTGSQTVAGVGTISTTLLYTGDNRPQKLVFREGHLYETHVAWSQNDMQVGVQPGIAVVNFGPFSTLNVTTPASSTVQYTIIQALRAGSALDTKKVVLRTQWWNTYAFAPMYEVPANVSLSGQVSPINLFPWLEKLFVATTYPALSLTDPRASAQWDPPGAATTGICQGPASPAFDPSIPSTAAQPAYAGLYDMRCGTDAYDTRSTYRSPIGGQLLVQTNNPETATLTTRNSAAIDPFDGSMWNYGIYATRRFATVLGPGQWSSYVANYNMAVQTAQSDPYGNGTLDYANDPVKPGNPWYNPIQIARNVGLIAQPTASGVSGTTITTVVPSNITGTPSGSSSTRLTRIEVMKHILISKMDETAITEYLNRTGGCAASFADVPSPAACANGGVTNTTGLLAAAGTVAVDQSSTAPPPATIGGWRYAEAAYRMGLTKGCSLTNAAIRQFCPVRAVSRGEVAVFLIRAKMNNVFPTSLNGCSSFASAYCVADTTQSGDGFAQFVAASAPGNTPVQNAMSGNGYFCDTSRTTTPSTCGGNVANDDYWTYIQKLFELRISIGKQLPTIATDNTIAGQGRFGRDDDITRGELLVWLVRAFFF